MIRASQLRIVENNDSLQPHPAAEIFPMMPEADFEKLVADIKANGQRDPIILHDGLILDGRNRYRACRQAGVDARLEMWDGNGTPESFVISKNLHRRHLNESQRAMVAKKLATLTAGGDRRSDQSANLRNGHSQDEAAELLHVSRRSVQHAAVVLDKAAPEMVQAVERGDISVSTAAQLAHLPKPRQREIAEEGKKAAAKAAKQVRLRSQPRHEPPAAPRETEHDRDLRFLRDAWASTCSTAHDAFLLEIGATIE